MEDWNKWKNGMKCGFGYTFHLKSQRHKHGNKNHKVLKLLKIRKSP